jgi:Uma2 family endonuclease
MVDNSEQQIGIVYRHGEIVAVNVSEDEYMERYAGDFCEWVGGVVIKMPPVSLKHDALTDYLRDLLKAYFTLKPIGRLVGAPFVMRIKELDLQREPDLQVILKANAGKLKDTYMEGAADICIEVISHATASVDYGEKFTEYEEGGVGEYWIIDPIRQECRFYRLNEKNLYKSQSVDEDDNYTTPKLPSFKLHVPTLWQDELPNFYQVAEAVKIMIGNE